MSKPPDTPSSGPRYARYPDERPNRVPASLKQRLGVTPNEGLVRELYKRGPRDVWTPSFSVAVRMLILVRVCGAMYSSVVADCDEVYNYWEPLHFLLYGDGFRTWEYSPKYAIRSWAYILAHVFPAKLFSHVNPRDKRLAFFAVRIALASLSTVCECRFYRSVVDNISVRIGRYTFLFLMVSAGMYNAATAFLPSSFSMYLFMLGWSYALEPVSANSKRTHYAVASFATAAVLGWPFTILLAVPFVLEELLLAGRSAALNFPGRLQRLLQSAGYSLAILGIVLSIDSFFYGRSASVAWNIVRYNVASDNPDLYGTSPWYFYILNGILNLNLVLPLALLSLPMVLVTGFVEAKKFGIAKPGQTSSALLLSLRLLPFYIWFILLSSQAHKEERFMFPAFPFACMNAAVSLGLFRGWMEATYVKLTKAPYKAARSSLFGGVTGAALIATTVIGFARIAALQTYFRAPMSILYHLQYMELPGLAIYTYPEQYPKLNLTNFMHANEQINVDVLQNLNLTLCYGAEWYRFPSSFLVPSVVRTEFLKSDLGIQLPKHFVERRSEENAVRASIKRRLEIARDTPDGYNDQNIEMMDRYVPEEFCSYIVDLDFPERRRTTSKAPLFSPDKWDRVVCQPYLDNEASSQLTRSFRFPGLAEGNVYGDFCLLRAKRLAQSI